MSQSFGKVLRRLRIEKNLSQQQLAKQLFVDRSSVANWEAGRRMPGVTMISRLAECLGVDTETLLHDAESMDERPLVIMVDDERIILTGGMPILQEVMPGAEIIGFTKPSQALELARNSRVAIAFLDIEMGMVSGLKLCEELLRINPRTNVIFLTAYAEYAIDAWGTGAGGFVTKPITADEVRRQLSLLRYPVGGLGI